MIMKSCLLKGVIFFFIIEFLDASIDLLINITGEFSMGQESYNILFNAKTCTLVYE